MASWLSDYIISYKDKQAGAEIEIIAFQVDLARRLLFFKQLLPECKQMQCQFKCAMFRNGTACYCEDGYEVGTDGKTCQDLNECKLYGTCSQTCANTDGSYTCSCVEGYLLQPDKKSCTIKREPNDSPPVLLITNSETIDVVYLNGSRASALASIRGSGIQTLDYVYSKDTICWIESRESSNQLKCIKTSKTGMLTDEWIISTIPNLHNIQQMAIDWLTGNFYFVDRISDTIFVCNYNGTVCVTLIDLDLHNPRAVAVDPSSGW
ncbi:low-density lipoprotein receptor-related protein 1B-like [Sphaerodactylus townsendi]|uniref:low-density lipoprotein receptor-related protein 1B-like n=1 Tax=Sphaerodactylus townsendi TaxID=933632 RepID=UPI0020267327|nr:low-density lipoprotein receptor-related protein 1B-like [Sphaerodactylus townsendi]